MKTNTSPQTVNAKGIRKGQHYRFINGHQCCLASPRGEKSMHWTGNDVGYSGAHRRVVRIRGKAIKCEKCGNQESGVRYQWANLTGNYPDPTDYMQMCPSCHKRHDVSPERLKQISAIGNNKIKNSPEVRKKMSLSAKKRWQAMYRDEQQDDAENPSLGKA